MHQIPNKEVVSRVINSVPILAKRPVGTAPFHKP